MSHTQPSGCSPPDARALHTLYDIEELQGFVAAAANHTDDRRLEEELSALHERLQREMERYDDGNWQTSPDVIE